MTSPHLLSPRISGRRKPIPWITTLTTRCIRFCLTLNFSKHQKYAIWVLINNNLFQNDPNWALNYLQIILPLVAAFYNFQSSFYFPQLLSNVDEMSFRVVGITIMQSKFDHSPHVISYYVLI